MPNRKAATEAIFCRSIDSSPNFMRRNGRICLYIETKTHPCMAQIFVVCFTTLVITRTIYRWMLKYELETKPGVVL